MQMISLLFVHYLNIIGDTIIHNVYWTPLTTHLFLICALQQNSSISSITKTFHNFRNLVTAFKKASKDATDKMTKSGGWKNVPESTQNLIAFSDAVSHVIDSEPISHFMGKMTFSSVQELASERRNTLNKALRVLTENYPASTFDLPSPSGTVSQTPTGTSKGNSKPIQEFKKIVNDFFLTDHVYEEDSDSGGIADRAIMADASVDSLDCVMNSDRAVVDLNVATGSHPTVDTSTVSENGGAVGKTKKTRNPSQSPRIGGTSKLKKRISKKVLKDKSKASSVSSPKENGKRSPSKVDDSLVESPVRPMSVKKRMSTRTRSAMKRELMKSKELSFHDSAVVQKKSYLDSPLTVAMMLIGFMAFFLWLPRITITIALDTATVIIFGAITFGMSLVPDATPNYISASPMNRNRKRVDSETLMRKSLSLGKDKSRGVVERKPTFLETIVTTTTDTFDNGSSLSPIKKFPDDAEIGSMFNCWSEPICSEFKVRGANYLKDKIKVASGSFLFPARGVDVFLSDCCPEHIAR